jgi:hypothetical protein
VQRPLLPVLLSAVATLADVRLRPCDHGRSQFFISPVGAKFDTQR